MDVYESILRQMVKMMNEKGKVDPDLHKQLPIKP